MREKGGVRGGERRGTTVRAKGGVRGEGSLRGEGRGEG